MPMLWIALHLPQLPLQAFQRGLPSPEPSAVAERQCKQPALGFIDPESELWEE